MRVTIRPGTARGTVAAPPSKSMAHRLLIAGALSAGESVIRDVPHCEDVDATQDCLTALGAVIRSEGAVRIAGGFDPFSATPTGPLACRESGSTLRFLVPLALLSHENTVFSGSEVLMRRPLNLYGDLCRERGLLFSQDAHSLVVRGPLTAGTFHLPGNVSSQFISGLLFALPLLPADSEIQLIPPVESQSYIDLTVAALSTFGVTVERPDERTLRIPGGQRYAPADVTVEGDYSGAAFLQALGALGGAVTVTGLREASLQGDRVFAELMYSLERGTPVISLSDCPDLGPVLFAVAAAKHGGVFTGTRRLKMKESDRAAAMAEELRKFGAAVTVHEDSVVVYPAAFGPPREPLYGHNDHRIVMALAVLLTRTGGTIDGGEAVNKSFPGFFDRLRELGLEVITDDTD